MNLAVRAQITRATLERFAGRPFAFGSCDCGLMVISHLKAMGWPIRTGGTWKTATALKRFLNRHGGSGASAIDGWGVPRIAPAAVIVGDIVEMEGNSVIGSFGICLGNGRVLGFHEDVDSAVVMQPVGLPIITAWRT